MADEQALSRRNWLDLVIHATEQVAAEIRLGPDPEQRRLLPELEALLERLVAERRALLRRPRP